MRPLVVLLLVILVIQALSGAGSSSTSGTSVNWVSPNGNQGGTNSVEQDQLNRYNANGLSLAWSYPFPASSLPAGLNLTGQGAIAPPLAVNGVVYVVMNDLHVLALRATDGALLWSTRPTLNRTGLPLGNLAGHVHGLVYRNGEVWLSLPDCSALALDAGTGAFAQKIADICANIPGNSGKYDYSGAPITFYKNSLIWTGSSVSEGTDAGRGFVAAYNVANGSLLWRWFVSPPSGGDPNWDAESCVAPCHGNMSPYPGDWGNLGLTDGRTRAGTGPGWGQPAVDTADGIIFLGTSQPSPDWNATYRPGPNLYSDSVVALNASSGRLLWFFQTTPHDLYDFDCGWNVVLGSTRVGNINTTTVFKACKNGYVYALDAKNGNLLWYFSPPSVVRSGTSNGNFVATRNYNATQKWTPSYSGTVTQCPGINGGVESDISFAYGKIFVATHNFCAFVTPSAVSMVGSGISGAQKILFDFNHANTTIYALDASSGHVVWSYFLQGIPYRGWLTATGGMAFASTLNGDIVAFDATSGSVVGSTHVGSGLYEGITVGTDGNGNLKIFQLTSSSAYGGFATGAPGALMAFTLPRNSPVFWVLVLFALGGVGAGLAAIAGFKVLRRRTGGARRHGGQRLYWRRLAVLP